MTTLRSLSVFAALSLAAVAYGQTQTARPGGPSTPTTSATIPSTNPELTGASTEARHDSPRNEAARPTDAPRMSTAAPGKIQAGMQVRSESGDLLGNVASIVPGESNREGYVVIANSKGVATPLPYSTANAMVRNDTVVVNKSRFENAPKVQQYQGEDMKRSAWEQKADGYWKHYAVGPSQLNGVNR
jgi:hypothetical protein